MILVRGAGELATGVAVSLRKSGYAVVMTELPKPLAVRRTVSFCQSLFDGAMEVEGIKAVKCELESALKLMVTGPVVIIDDTVSDLSSLRPKVLVDARMLKTVLPDMRGEADLTIGLGPGFSAGGNCHLAIETLRGHNLGRILKQGSPAENTGIPGNIQGETRRRVVRAPAAGIIDWQVEFGDLVSENDPLGSIDGQIPVTSPLAGIVRGLIAPGLSVTRGLKIADVDPRGSAVNFHSISDKARTVGRAVLEAILSSGILPERPYES